MKKLSALLLAVAFIATLAFADTAAKPASAPMKVVAAKKLNKKAAKLEKKAGKMKTKAAKMEKKAAKMKAKAKKIAK